MVSEYINLGLQWIISYATDNLLPFMVGVFLLGVLLRGIIYFTTKCEAAFALEFEKRVHKYLADPTYEHRYRSFHALTKRLLERTFEEHYNLKRKLRRRRMDQITSITDRIFMIPEGAKRLITDTLSQTKYLHKGGKEPKFLDISRWVFESNPVFNRVVGVFPTGVFHDILNIFPGLFVIGGIFGTFLGVMQALPMLSEMDITNVESTKAIMDSFLLKMAFSMGTSVVGIILSVAMTMLNALLNPDGIYYSMVNKFTSALEFLWNDTATNEILEGETGFEGDRRVVSYSSGRPGRPEAAANFEESHSGGVDLAVAPPSDTSSLSELPEEFERLEARAKDLPTGREIEQISPFSPADSADVPAPGDGEPAEEETSGQQKRTPLFGRRSVSEDAPSSRKGLFGGAFGGRKGAVSTDAAGTEAAASEPPSPPEAKGTASLEELFERAAAERRQHQTAEDAETPTYSAAAPTQTPAAFVEKALEGPIPEVPVNPPESASDTGTDRTEEFTSLWDRPPESPRAAGGETPVASEEEEAPLPEGTYLPPELSGAGVTGTEAGESHGGEARQGLSTLESVFSQMDSMLNELGEESDSAAPPARGESSGDGVEDLEARLEILRHRLKVLDEYLHKADEDRLTGRMSEDMWREETERYATEREQIQNEIEELEDEDKAA